VRQDDPVRSVADRVWSYAIGFFLLAIVINVTVALIRPVLPWVVAGAVVALVIRVWLSASRSRW
jgi:hypothetical protein